MHKDAKEIYFHVGLGKTASKFLQHKIFPKLQGIHYIKPTQYKNSHRIIERGDVRKFLVSREFDNQLEPETEKFASRFPNARIIIVLRRHDLWMASQYRRHVKNGYSRSFEEFIDIENDRGFWRRDKVFFLPKLKHLEKLFGTKPLVLFHDDLAKDPVQFIGKIIEFTGTKCDINKLNLNYHHASYSEKQLKVMRKTGKLLFNQKEIEYSENPVLNWMQRRSRLFACYAVLYAALLLPDALLESEPLIPDEALEKVRRFYADDWNKCITFK